MEDSTSKERADDVALSKFVAGIRVLVVDDNLTDLLVLEEMLRACSYKVIKCQRGEDALSMLQEKRDGFDIVMTDVRMPNIDGLQLLAEIVRMELALPVIMFSGDADEDVVVKGVMNGACDFLVKPIRMDTLRIIWQHVLRNRRSTSVKRVPREPPEVPPTASLINCTSNSDVNHVAQDTSPTNEESSQISLRTTPEDDGGEHGPKIATTASSATKKRPRLVWTPELQRRFTTAIKHIGGLQNALPKKILECMRQMGDEPGLTRQKISSHLQKYRLSSKKNGETSERCSSSLYNGPTSYSNPSHRSIPALVSCNTNNLQSYAQEDQWMTYLNGGGLHSHLLALPHQTSQQNTICHQQQQQISNNLVHGTQINSSDPFVMHLTALHTLPKTQILNESAGHHFNSTAASGVTTHPCATQYQNLTRDIMNSPNLLNVPTGMGVTPHERCLPPNQFVSNFESCCSNTDTVKGELGHAYYEAPPLAAPFDQEFVADMEHDETESFLQSFLQEKFSR